MKKILIYLLSIIILSIIRCYFKCDIFNITLDEFIYYSNYIPIFLLPAILIEEFSKNSKWYFVGINIDIYLIRDIFIGVITAVLSVGLIVLIALAFFDISIYFNKSNISNFLINVPTILNNVGVEELLFRGLIFQIIMRSWRQTYTVIISSLLFAISHIFFIDYMNFVLFMNTFLAGILFCQMYIKTNSLWLPFSFHSMWNISIFLFWERSSKKLMYNDSIFNIVFNDKNNTFQNILFGNYYNFESGILCTIILCILIYFTITKVKPSYGINAEILKREYLP